MRSTARGKRAGTPSAWLCTQGVKGPEWEVKYSQHKELHQAVKSKKSHENKKARVLWALKEAKEKGMEKIFGRS